jgi:hypothetical protein
MDVSEEANGGEGEEEGILCKIFSMVSTREIFFTSNLTISNDEHKIFETGLEERKENAKENMFIPKKKITRKTKETK